MTAAEQAELWAVITTAAVTLIPVAVAFAVAFLRQEMTKLQSQGQQNHQTIASVAQQIADVQSSVNDVAAKQANGGSH